MDSGLVRIHTELVAQQLQNRFSEDPEGEIQAWLAIAQQREAMVVQVYAGAAIERRLPAASAESEPLLRVVRKAIGGIWAQESSHTALMGALRSVDGVRAKAMRSVIGTIEGLMTSVATARGPGGPLARWLIDVARVAGQTPEFVRYLQEMSLGEFLRFSMELEDTANRGYVRILALVDALEEDWPSTKYGISQRYEFIKTGAEERFHFAVFQRLASWLTPDESGFAPQDPMGAVIDLRELAKQTLAVHLVPGAAEALGRPGVRGGDVEPDAPLVSDGGLGSLFHEFDVGVHVALEPAT